MKKTLVIAKREFMGYFTNPLGFITLTCFLLVNSIVFWITVNIYNSPEAPYGAVMRLFFGGHGNPFFWIFMFIFTPVITMRLFSEEIKSGTIELLMTAPVSETQIVIGKFFGAYIFYIFLWIPTVFYPLIMGYYSKRLEVGPILSGYCGVFLLGGMFIQIGQLCSSFSKSQVSAAILCFVALMLFFLMNILKYILPETGFLTVLTYLDFMEWLDYFAKGIIDTRPVIFFCSFIICGLFINIKFIETRKWV